MPLRQRLAIVADSTVRRHGRARGLPDPGRAAGPVLQRAGVLPPGPGFTVWAALRSLGRSGVADMVEVLHRAAQFAAGLSAIDGVEVLNDVVYTQVCVSFGPDEVTREVARRLLAEDGLDDALDLAWARRTADLGLQLADLHRGRGAHARGRTPGARRGPRLSRPALGQSVRNLIDAVPAGASAHPVTWRPFLFVTDRPHEHRPRTAHASAPTLADRRKTRQIKVGKVLVGGDARQCAVHDDHADRRHQRDAAADRHLTATGCDIVRVAVPSQDDADALPAIAAKSQIPVIADIHFQPKYVFAAIDAGCAAVRVNPGNIRAFDDQVKIAQAAGDRGISIRIGVNAGSRQAAAGQYGKATPRRWSSRRCGRRACSRSTGSATSRSASSTTTRWSWCGPTRC